MSMIGNFVAISDAELAAVMADPPSIAKLFYPGEGRSPERHLDLHKTWDILHFLLTHGRQNSRALDFIHADRAIRGAQLGGFGWDPTAMTSFDVRAFAEALAPMTLEKLFESWDLTAMLETEVYMIDEDTAREEQEEFVGPFFEDLKAFVSAAASDELALVFYVH